MNLRRGGLRLLFSLAVLWLVYWSFAFVFRTPQSIALPGIAQLPPAVAVSLVGGAIFALWWTVSGFRR